MRSGLWEAWASGRQPRLHGRHVAAVLAFVAIATAVGPAALGWTLNTRRETRTEARARQLADLLGPELQRISGLVTEVRVVCGPGRLPDPGPTGQWVSRAVQAPGVFPEEAPTDAWGRCFLLNLEALVEGGPLWLISAGTDGLVSTYPTAEGLADDDIGVRVR